MEENPYQSPNYTSESHRSVPLVWRKLAASCLRVLSIPVGLVVFGLFGEGLVIVTCSNGVFLHDEWIVWIAMGFGMTAGLLTTGSLFYLGNAIHPQAA